MTVRQTSLVRALSLCTCGIIAYCLIAAVNSRATYSAGSGTFDYHQFCRWLPSSFDGQSTWAAFWICLALVCSFWAIWHWFNGGPRQSVQGVASLPARIELVLWVLAVSGAVLGVEAIAQRLSASSKLLFLVLPGIHQEAVEQFGSYAYRANAAQFFNLLWPVCLGSWCVLLYSRKPRWCARLMLLCAGIIAACPIVSSARGAVLTEGAMLLTTMPILFFSVQLNRAVAGSGRVAFARQLVLFIAVTLGLGLGLGWNQLRPRLAFLREGFLERQELFQQARGIASDYPLFGTGPGTFEQVFQLYRTGPQEYWPAQLHNDWLEIRITWGWVGSAIILAALLLILLRPAICKGTAAVEKPLVLFTSLSLAGCLFQAGWDFPFQVYSILFVCVVWCALLFTDLRRS